MAYDLGSFYTNVIGVNSLSKTIIDQMMSQNRFSSVSKITLPGLNYSSGSAQRDPIGYTETGRPIYEQNVGMTMNDDLKDALEKKHARNTDTMLRGIGTNVVENTSTGNIVAFASNGVYKAFITESGRFTGSIRLENIEDLNTLTLDTSRFYIKSEIDGLLTAKVSKASLFNAENKIHSDLLDADIVRHVTFDPHFNDDIRHITQVERDAWNNKYLKPVSGIPMLDLAKAVQDRINASALDVEFKTHANNLDIHTSTQERAKWNAKYDKPSTGIPMTDFSEIVQNAINEKAKAVDLQNHKDDVIRHITGEERTAWNSKYNKPAGGIPLTHLEAFVQEVINTSASDAELQEHVNDEVSHITNGERLTWNAKYLKPSTGVPETDLDTNVQSKINQAATKTEVANHTSNSTVHITELERQNWNGHKADGVIHITAEERLKWNAKYDKPSLGIPETDLSAGLQTKINSMTTTTDFNDHITDTVKHITQSERDEWNSKYEKPLNGIPEFDLSEELQNKINSFSSQNGLDAHIANNVTHVTELERSGWNSKYVKPVTGIPETDLTQALRDKLASFATSLALTTHVGDMVKHITVEERSAWNGKYVKPVTGIPATDLEAGVKAKIEGSASNADLVTHTGNDDIHITPDERANWNGKYSKPLTGVPETDLEQSLRTKINNMVTTTDFNAHATDSVKHVTASERTTWNGKYVKPSTGIPMTDLTQGLQDKINSSATITAFNAHTADTTAHVSSVERTAWNGKYSKPSTGVPEVDLAQAVQDKLSNSESHIANTTVHITSAERTEWDAKYVKPVAGIPVSDMEQVVAEGLNASQDHIEDTVVHVTADERTAWNGKYDLPVGGLPLGDLVAELQAKLNSIAVPYVKTVSVEATTVSVTAQEHGISHTNGYEYSVVAYRQNGDFWETVVPSLVKVDQTTKNIEVQFGTAFTGRVVVR
jgi:hypothetical protein